MKEETYIKRLYAKDNKELMKIADDIFSQWVRLEGSQLSNGVLFNRCYTCNSIKNVKAVTQGLDCGHYIKRDKKYVRFNPDNCRPQCTYCNKYRSGEEAKFRIRLVEEIGEMKVLKMESEQNLPVKKRELYISTILKYKPLVKERLNEVGFKNWGEL